MELALGRVPALAARRDQAVHQRPGELHARRQLHPRRGAGGARTSSSAPASTPSASPAAAAPAWRWPNGWRRARRPTTSGRSTSAASAATTARRAWVRTRTLEAYAKHYTMAWPREEYASGRPLPPLAALRPPEGARAPCFGEKLGWERPNWFAGAAARSPRDIYTFGRPNWFEAVGREHRACREAAALFDQTSFAKFLLTGPRRRGGARPGSAPNDVDAAAGHAHLHPDAERPRRHRVRPDRRAPGRGRATTSSPAPASPPTTSTGSAATSRTALDAPPRRRHLAVRGAGADGPAGRATSSRRSPTTTSRTPPSPSAAVAPALGRRRAGASRCASPTSASSAGSCTSRSSSPPPSTTR